MSNIFIGDFPDVREGGVNYITWVLQALLWLALAQSPIEFLAAVRDVMGSIPRAVPSEKERNFLCPTNN